MKRGALLRVLSPVSNSRAWARSHRHARRTRGPQVLGVIGTLRLPPRLKALHREKLSGQPVNPLHSLPVVPAPGPQEKIAAGGEGRGYDPGRALRGPKQLLTRRAPQS